MAVTNNDTISEEFKVKNVKKKTHKIPAAFSEEWKLRFSPQTVKLMKKALKKKYS